MRFCERACHQIVTGRWVYGVENLGLSERPLLLLLLLLRLLAPFPLSAGNDGAQSYARAQRQLRRLVTVSDSYDQDASTQFQQVQGGGGEFIIAESTDPTLHTLTSLQHNRRTQWAGCGWQEVCLLLCSAATSPQYEFGAR